MKKYNMIFLVLVLGFSMQAQNKTPCSTSEFHEFDFWIGEWVVHDSTGKEVGQNTIKTVEGGCALTERWIGASGTTGRSINYYSATDSAWHQVWVDNGGTVLELQGRGSDGSMTLESEERISPKGQVFVHEIEWTLLEDGRVRQHWRARFNDGTSPSTVFLGFYTKK